MKCPQCIIEFTAANKRKNKSQLLCAFLYFLLQSLITAYRQVPKVNPVIDCILKTVVLMLLCARLSYAEEHRVTPESDLKKLVQKISAGDSIVLENGNWKDVELKFESLAGTENSPISIVAQTPGKVIFSGNVRFRVSGRHVVVSGLVFRDCTSDKDVFELRTDKKELANHSRITQCVFEQTKEIKTNESPKWLSIHGSNNRVDHCYFAGKTTPGATLVVWLTKEIEKHQIDHNFFGPRPPLGQNGGETMRIGTSTNSELVCQSVVEDNYFFQCNGEAEIISNKSCENTYRHNLFDQCDGTLSLRHGHRCLVDGNVFLGREKSGTGGVRVVGQNHRVVNNYFEGLRGETFHAAIGLMNGIPNGPLNGYAPVEGAIVAHNTLINCKSSIEIGVGAGSRNRVVVPKDCLIANNVINSGSFAPLHAHAGHEGVSWKGNKQQSGNDYNNQLVNFDRVDLQLSRIADGMLRPAKPKRLRTEVLTRMQIRTDVDGEPRHKMAVAGCDDPRTDVREFPTPANTGPDWWRAQRR
jgi:poly(beta-D-mannuronate) lyase